MGYIVLATAAAAAAPHKLAGWLLDEVSSQSGQLELPERQKEN